MIQANSCWNSMRNSATQPSPHMLWYNERKCDQVIRTLFNGTVLGVDNWEVLCRDRRSYSISVLVEPELHDTINTLLSGGLKA
jgi:hypothetical protein